ncbi:MAG: hypothetical protein PHC61_14150, partial [Chitinivibrionales bacterium]|nr:hypothetical protein [Chitinivibrionales bacterium]
KRKIIGETFLTVSAQAQKNLGLNVNDWILGQGTIYPDTIESAGTRHADKIKTHHNRVDGVLALVEQGKIIEPLAQLYKDEVRLVGKTLGIPERLIKRHPFPGPGLAVRILCSTGAVEAIDPAIRERLAAIAEESGFTADILPVRSVGVQGDSRTYAHPAVVFGPCDWRKLELLSTEITNKVRGINRVVYCLTSFKPAIYKLHPAYLSPERIGNLQKLDHLATETLYAQDEYDAVWQMPVVLLPIVNELGGECAVLRPVSSQEAMTARFKPLAERTLEAICKGAKAIPGIGDLFFDITHKPPGTIEWE